MKDKFSINIVNTYWGDHYLTSEGNRLLEQLDILSYNSNIIINILLNGDPSCEIWRDLWAKCNPHVKSLWERCRQIGNVRIYQNEGAPFTHGKSIQYLHDRCSTRYYICIDEDDEFSTEFMSHPTHLFKDLPEGKLVMYKFDWITKDSTNLYPVLKGSKYDMKSVRSFSNWNFIFDKHTLDSYGIVRPDINKYDDCLYYERLWTTYKGLCVLRDMKVLNYRNDHSILSVGSDEIQPYINYMLKNKVFSLIDVI